MNLQDVLLLASHLPFYSCTKTPLSQFVLLNSTSLFLWHTPQRQSTVFTRMQAAPPPQTFRTHFQKKRKKRKNRKKTRLPPGRCGYIGARIPSVVIFHLTVLLLITGKQSPRFCVAPSLFHSARRPWFHTHHSLLCTIPFLFVTLYQSLCLTEN